MKRTFWCAVLTTITTTACSSESRQKVTPVYDPATRQLIRLDYDYDGNGLIDVRTHMYNGRPVRLEGDTDQDGHIDRWEHYGSEGRLERLGGSTEADGIEDSWAYPSGDDLRLEISTRRDGVVDRREFYTRDVLQRVEVDTNLDGRVDTWEQYAEGRLTTILVDEDKRAGRPTRRIVYSGGAARVDVDPDGDGRFTPAEPSDRVPQAESVTDDH